MKRIIPRMLIMLAGITAAAVGGVNNSLWLALTGFFVFFFAVVALIEAEIYNRTQWDRMIKYYLKERDKRTEIEIKAEHADYELEELKKQLEEAEKKPTMVYVGGFKALTDSLNKVHERNMLKAVGVEHE